MNWLTKMSNSPRLVIWLGVSVFAYSWLAGLLLQMWVIPSMFSQAGASEGLVVLDSIGFDKIAKEKASEIVSLGWAAWELKPQFQSPAGIASFFYVMFGPVPTSVLPFNAAVHAAGSCVVMLILKRHFSGLPALLGAVFFALNPASFEWVAQIHRDGIFILGNLLFIYGVIAFFIKPVKSSSVWSWALVYQVLIPTIGIALVWVARPYWVQIMLVIMMAVFCVLVLGALLRWRTACVRQMAALTVAFFTVSAFQFWLVKVHTPYEPIDIPISETATATATATKSSQFSWKRSSWLPDVIEGRFYRLGIAREGAIAQGGNSLADGAVHLDSVGAVLGYLPRAIHLALFSPFPELWGGEASTPAMTIGRKVVGAVTVLFYLCLSGWLLALWRLRGELLVWVLLFQCLIGMVVYAIGYPNIGTLIRYRYGFYMLLVGFGVAVWCDLWLRITNKQSEI